MISDYDRQRSNAHADPGTLPTHEGSDRWYRLAGMEASKTRGHQRKAITYIIKPDDTRLPRPSCPRIREINLDLPRDHASFPLIWRDWCHVPTGAGIGTTTRTLPQRLDDGDHHVRSEEVRPERVRIAHVFLGVCQTLVNFVCKDSVEVAEHAIVDRGWVGDVEERDHRFGVAWMRPCCSGESEREGGRGTGEGAVGGHTRKKRWKLGEKINV